MYKFITFALFALICYQPAQAQWEQIGWRDGYLYVIGQVGNTLYGQSGNGYYISKDWGENWQIAREGLPLKRSIFSNIIKAKMGRAVLCNGDIYPNRSTDLFSYYYCTESDPRWRLKELTLIDSHWYLYDMSSFQIFSDDSLATLNIYDGYQELPYHSTNGVYVSLDGGQHWEKRTNGISLPITNSSLYRRLEKQGNNLVLYCSEPDTSKKKSRNLFYVSSNFGESWEKAPIPLPDSVEGEGRMEAISDSLLIFNTIGPFGYYFSNDRGASWFSAPLPLPRGEHHTIYPLQQRGRNVILSIRNNQKYELYRSSTNGRSWERFYASDSTFELCNLYGNDSIHVLLKPGYIDVWVSNSTLQNISLLVTKTGSLSDGGDAILFHDNHTFYTLDIAADSIWDSTSTGIYSSWSDNGDLLMTHRFKNEYILAYEPWTQHGSQWYAHGYRKMDSLSKLFKSTDAGNNWEAVFTLPIKSPFIWEFDTVIVSDSFLLVFFRDTIYCSKDSGRTWLGQPLPNDELSTLSFANDILYLLQNGRSLYTTTNFGESWTKTPLSDKIGYVRNGIYTAGQRIFISTAGQTYYSDDIGVTWTKAVTNSPQPFTISTFEDGILYGVSDNRENCQLHYSLDTGKTWQKLGDSCVAKEASLYLNDDFYFLASPAEIWRLPKSTLKVNMTDLPTSLTLSAAPNPLLTSTSITYSIPTRGTVDLSLYDLLGRKRSTIVSGMQDAGAHTVQWGVEDIQNGVYLLRLVTSEGSATRMLQVVR